MREIFKWDKPGDVGVGCSALALRVAFKQIDLKSICSELYLLMTIFLTCNKELLGESAAVESCDLLL